MLRLETVRVGRSLAVLVSLGSAVYALLTWDQPHRDLLLALSALALLSAVGIGLLPIERIVRGRWREPFFICWSALYVVAIAGAMAADGGTSSPFTLMIVLPLLFGSASYPLRAAIVVGILDVAAYLVVAISVDDGFVVSMTGAFTLAAAAVLCSWLARNQASRQQGLVHAAEALRQSEQTSTELARQQQAVASFGQLALEGADVDRLCAEAVEIIQRELAVEHAALLKHLPEEKQLEFRDIAGLPAEFKGRRIPVGLGSQAGYTLVTGEVVVVPDWSREERFEPSAAVRELGVTSGLTALISAKDHAFGVIGVQSMRRRDFSAEDSSFAQSIANVLANAIERRTAEEQTRHEALHDPLTGLPNRNLFLDRLGHALVQAARRGSSVAVLFLDLDQFKLVNDSLGHAAGDELLQSVASRFDEALRPGDTVARFGGDEFAILIEDVGVERDATRVAERIAESLARPFILRRREHFVSVSVGISIGVGQERPEALIRDADAALYRAKDQGRGRYEIFDSVMRARVVQHMETENDLRRALERGEIELHYQPVISLADGRIAALEALVRWQHPERGLLGPASFLAAAEDSQLIIPIGHRSIERACSAAAGWQELHPDGPPTRIAINVSARQLTDPTLPAALEAAIQASGIEPVTIELEMTETALLEESEAPEHCLSALKALGVRLILDDFGTGFSSLGYLRRFPLDGIKLDRSFVEDLAEPSADSAIVRAVVEMAGALGLEVVAEGVENAEQLEAVTKLGCHHAQGFHFSPPVAASEVSTLLREQPWATVKLAPDEIGP